jgi:hypothetical protein
MSDIPDILILYPISRIEALERTARVDASIAKQLGQSMAINARLQTRIETLEAVLREIEWHDPKSPAAATVRAVLDKDIEK